MLPKQRTKQLQAASDGTGGPKLRRHQQHNVHTFSNAVLGGYDSAGAGYELCYYDPDDTQHGHYGGACYAPNGPTGEKHLNTDGTGDDTIWINWVAAIANYVNNTTQTWCGSNCAHVKYWEIWNGFNRNNTDPNDPNESGKNPPKVSWFTGTGQYGCSLTPCPTVDQLIRMTEDAECVITGNGTIDNYASKGDSHPCSYFQNKQNPIYPGPFDSAAQIVQPSITGPGSVSPLRCYLYCDSGMTTGCPAWHGANSCANTWSNLTAAVDVMNFHYYATSNNPEDLNITQKGDIRYPGNLNQSELSKPLWVGEGSWGDVYQSGAWWQDPYAQGGVIPRYFATIWSQTLPTGKTPCSFQTDGNVPCLQAFWYGYDYDTTTVNDPTNFSPSQTGALYCPGETARGYCSPPKEGYPPFLITPQADMWNVAVGWLADAQIPNGATTLCSLLAGSNTVWHCDFTNSGATYSMVWDNSYSAAGKARGNPNYCAKNFANPYVCGNTTYTISPQYTAWEDLSGTVRALDTPIPFEIGLNPVLLCTNSACLP